MLHLPPRRRTRGANAAYAEGPWGQRPTIGPGGHFYAPWLAEPVSASGFRNCDPPTRIVTVTHTYVLPQDYPSAPSCRPQRSDSERPYDHTDYETWRATTLSAHSLKLLDGNI